MHESLSHVDPSKICNALVAYEIKDGTNPRSSKHDSARKGVDHGANQDWWGVGNGEKVDKLGETGYFDTKTDFFDDWNSDDDDGEMKRDFLKKNGDLINHEAVLKLLKV